jgi:hypothetical protein
MPYSTFFNWAFSGNIKDPIPIGEGIPEILKYNSPIHATFLLKTFVANGKLNFYLNKYLNNIGLRYIDKEDLFYFIKQCIIDFKINRRSIHYSKWSHNDALTNKLTKKFPLLKKDEIQILSDEIDKSDDKDAIYRTLGLDKKEFDKKKTKKKVVVKISTKNYIAKNFGII